MNMPDMFGITYMHNGNVPNDYLHKIGRCFLQGMDVVTVEKNIQHLDQVKFRLAKIKVRRQLNQQSL